MESVLALLIYGLWSDAGGLTPSIKRNSLLVQMELKDFGKYIQGKSPDKLLHRARRESLKRILASERELAVSSRKVSPPKRAASNK